MKLIDKAIAAHQRGDITEAESIYRRVLATDKGDFDALHMLGIICAQKEQFEEAERLIRTALSIDRGVPFCYHNYGNILVRLGRYQDAIENYNKALMIAPNFAPVYSDRGNALQELGRFEEALASYDQALNFRPNLADAWLGRSNALYNLKRYGDSFAAFNKAVALKPILGTASAWLDRGNVFYELNRYDEALLAYDKALSIMPDLAAAWLGRGNIFYNLKHYDSAFAAIDKAMALKPDLAEAWLCRGNILYGLKRYEEASLAYDKALSIKPDLAAARLGRGIILFDLRRFDEALVAFDKALAFKPDLAEAWLGRGNIFHDLRRHEEAFSSFDKALTIKPDLISVEGARLRSKMFLCDWGNLKAECEHLVFSVKNNKANAVPFIFIGISKSAEEQLKCAKLWVGRNFVSAGKPIWSGNKYVHDRIRIAYVSTDFRQHPTSYLMARLIECHDKSQYEVTAISIGPDDNSEMRRRLMSSFEQFIDARALSDDEVISRIRKAEIDILIDLNGFTQGARTAVFASRPAPIQVNYLGYPGTMGADFIDYLIADSTLIPKSHLAHYAEKIVFLPNSYQVNDSTRPIADTNITRAEGGLPQKGFVFCCFNSTYKITPEVFDCWMLILKRVENSVLWLLEDNVKAIANLRKEAAARDINPERLVFAKRMPQRDHLARHRLADLFLDTLPYNAHMTASDALWAGLPVLTCIGETFAGRVAASLLNAVGLPELITLTLDAFGDLAIELATNSEKLDGVKRKLANNRNIKPLFDTQLFTGHIEEAYQLMYKRYQEDLPPDHIFVPL